MQFSGFSRYESGVILPVSALRSRKSVGIGEFADLPLLGKFCAKTGLRFLQILPVNDTGKESSPYSALSAYALHPVYIRIEDLPEYHSSFASEIKAARSKFEKNKRVTFTQVVSFKEDLLQKIFQKSKADILHSSELFTWIEKNPWVVPYAAYRLEKSLHNERAWIDWQIPFPGMDALVSRIEKREEELWFYAWVQKRLEEQFVAAASQLDREGVCLKGDLPILMGDDSADVWAYPHLFFRSLRAGAPPDMFSYTGQNWGFPIYNWEALEREDYHWWKERLKRANLFYHAFRIDHVLGFFRIWALPEKETSGVLGFYLPSIFFTLEDLQQEGFDTGRIRWLSEPHVPGEVVRTLSTSLAPELRSALFQQINQEDLYLFRSEVGERWIETHVKEVAGREQLINWYRNRFLVSTPFGYAPAWYRDSARSLSVLSEEEKRRLQILVSRYYRDSEILWEKEGEKLLRTLVNATGMLPCAEDLGVVPDCVPQVLQRLGILGLRIPRWTRRYKEPGEPFIPPEEYPLLTVCAASVHDTSTLRQWWIEEADRDAFWHALGYTGHAPSEYTPRVADQLLSGIFNAQSVLAVAQLQDFLSLTEKYPSKNLGEDRINTPGTVSENNWSYRIPCFLEDLLVDAELMEKVNRLTTHRTEKPF
ncbi:MAG: 4-alpha-glucanotransferase, partial [Spirochaetales bacterium]